MRSSTFLQGRGPAAAAAVALLVLAIPATCQGQPAETRDVYKDARKQRRGYFGTGREEPEPQGLHAVLLGYFGPDDPSHPEGGTFWMGANLALEEANAEGGYKGLPFKLVQAWAENPWADGVSKVVRMAYLERVWGIIGSIDGTTTHLAEQVVAKARVLLIDPGSTDDSVNQANVAWMFSCLPGDRAITEALGNALRKEAGDSFALLTSTDHDSRALAAEFKSYLTRAKLAPRHHVEFAAASEQVDALAAQTAAQDVKAVVIFAGPKDSARVVRELRKRNKGVLIFGGPPMGRYSFQTAAGAASENVRVPILTEPSPALGAFAKKFAAQYGFEPDFAAIQAYDAVKLLAAAIRKAGLNRVRILDALDELSPWQGAGGVIRWDELGRNARGVKMGVIRGGRPEL